MLLYCHLTAFCAVHSDFKRQPNDHLTTYNVCEVMFALVYYVVGQLQTALSNAALIHLTTS